MQISVYKTSAIRVRPVDSTIFNVLVGALFYSCAKHYHWGKLGEGYTESLCIIFIVPVNQQLSQQQKKDLKKSIALS